jgi:hypothetical protein
MVILLELTTFFHGVLLDQDSNPLTTKETGLLKRQEISPSPHVAGDNPRSTWSGKCTSAASSQGALVHQDTLETTRKLQKNHHVY